MTSLEYDTSLEAMETWAIHWPLSLPSLHSEIHQYFSLACKRIQVEMLSGDNIAQHKSCGLFSNIAFKFPLFAGLFLSVVVYHLKNLTFVIWVPVAESVLKDLSLVSVSGEHVGRWEVGG